MDQILQDNCTPITDGTLRPGDVIRYRLNGVTTHTGRVWQTDGDGHCAKVRSKWGSNSERIHDPLDVPGINGTELAYFRQHSPLLGIGDLWIKDSASDDGSQCSQSLWVSPDILVDAPPYGSSNLNPVFGVVNRVWATVRNRGDLAVNGFRVRYYWADPGVGFAPADWHLIPSAPGHPNPTDPVNVPAYGTVQAPYVEWVPAIAEAHQCLLAVAYVTDNPRDSTDPDTLVYPFDIRWDNNIAARNCIVIPLGGGRRTRFTIGVGLPFDRLRRVKAMLRLRLTATLRPPFLGLLTRLRPPEVTFWLDRQGPTALVRVPVLPPTDEYWRYHLGREHDLSQKLSSADVAELAELQEWTVAVGGGEVLLRQGERRQLDVGITMPGKPDAGVIYQLRIEQWIGGELTGAYTAVVPPE